MIASLLLWLGFSSWLKSSQKPGKLIYLADFTPPTPPDKDPNEYIPLNDPINTVAIAKECVNE